MQQNKIVRDKIFQEVFPELHLLCCIALSIPLATAWPERQFSTMCRVKTKHRNRLLNVTLNALINVLMNSPNHLDDKSVVEVVQNWTTAKNRRKVTKRALQTMMSADDIQETDAFADEQELCVEVEICVVIL